MPLCSIVVIQYIDNSAMEILTSNVVHNVLKHINIFQHAERKDKPISVINNGFYRVVRC